MRLASLVNLACGEESWHSRHPFLRTKPSPHNTCALVMGWRLNLLILALYGVLGDEFASPSHTKTVQIISPRPDVCSDASKPITIAVAAPKVHISVFRTPPAPQTCMWYDVLLWACLLSSTIFTLAIH